MVTHEEVRRAEAPAATPLSTWPRSGVVLGPDGMQVSGVVVLGPPRNGRIILDSVDDPGALLTHHFGRGGRRVALYLDGDVVEGWLTTAWGDGRRDWWLEVDA